MKSNVKNMLRIFWGPTLVLILVAGIGMAQQPTPTPVTETGEDAGDYTIVSSIEVGVRGLSVVGDVNKYKSDLNSRAGFRVFDSSFLVRAKEGKGGVFDTLLVTTTGWGADPQGSMRFSVEKPEWYRFDGNYRRSKYFRFLNNFANPNWLFTGFPVPPNPLTGLHGYNTNMAMGDFDLTILPKNEKIRFNVGYSPERYSGPYFSNYHVGGNEFQLLVNSKSRANDWRFGADGKLGPIDWTFIEGFRRFRDDSDITMTPTFINPNPVNVFRYTSFSRTEPTRTNLDFTRFSIHTLVAKKLDITASVMHSRVTSDSVLTENFTGTNFNGRITGYPPTPPPALPNTLTFGQYYIPSTVKRPDTRFDFGVTYLATDKFRLSNTFRVEDFEINGTAIFNDTFVITRPGPPPVTNTFTATNRPANRIIKYRKYSDTIEGDYQFNRNYSVHFGYRYGSRRDELILTGFGIGSNNPAPIDPEDEVDRNHTHAFFGGFRARPLKDWTIYFDAEHGTADNVFTRIGNYDYTNVRAKSRYAPNRHLNFTLSFITKDNSNPSEIAGVSLSDFGVDVKSRMFQASVDWLANSRFSLSTGYVYNWVNSDAVIDYYYNSVRHPMGHTLYFMRNNYFFIESTARLAPRVTLYTAYRINQDDGQGDRREDPTGTPGTLINSYPMNFQTPEGRLTVKLHRRLDWNVGYSYYNYNESKLLQIAGSPRAQNYHAHQPYTSLRFYFGRDVR